MTTHRFLVRLALSLAHIFGWIFAFHYFYRVSGDVLGALVALAATYALTHVIVVLVTPLSARALRNGARRMIRRALIALAFGFAVYAAALAGVLGNIGWGIGLFAILFGLYRAWYWIPYSVQSQGHTKLSLLQEIALACAPAIAGIVLAAVPYGAPIILALAAAIALVSIAPVYFMPEAHEGFSMSFRQSFHELFNWHRAPSLFASVANGFEGAALLLLWPVIVFTLVGWSYAVLGIVLSLTFLATMIIRMVLKALGWNIRSGLVQSVLTISAWVMRSAVAAPLSIIVVDTYYHAGAGSSSRSVDARVFEQAADNHTFVDEQTALKEMGQAIGRILFCTFIIVAALYATFPIVVLSAFGLAAIAGALSIYFARRASRIAF